MGDCVVAGPAKGIYYIQNWLVNIPIQIVATRELKGKEYAGFRAVSKKPKEEDVFTFMKEHEGDKENASFVRAFADGVSKVDSELIEELKGRYPDMSKTLLEIMKPEIDEKIDNITRTNLYIYVQDGDMMLERAAQRAGMSAADFSNAMANAGYTVPQGTSRL